MVEHLSSTQETQDLILSTERKKKQVWLVEQKHKAHIVVEGTQTQAKYQLKLWNYKET